MVLYYRDQLTRMVSQIMAAPPPIAPPLQIVPTVDAPPPQVPGQVPVPVAPVAVAAPVPMAPEAVAQQGQIQNMLQTIQNLTAQVQNQQTQIQAQTQTPVGAPSGTPARERRFGLSPAALARRSCWQ